MRRILIHRWKPGFNKVGLNHLLREQAGFTLSSAKASIDRLLEGEEILVDLDDDAADNFLDAVKQLGVDVQVVDRVA